MHSLATLIDRHGITVTESSPLAREWQRTAAMFSTQGHHSEARQARDTALALIPRSA